MLATGPTGNVAWRGRHSRPATQTEDVNPYAGVALIWLEAVGHRDSGQTDENGVPRIETVSFRPHI